MAAMSFIGLKNKLYRAPEIAVNCTRLAAGADGSESQQALWVGHEVDPAALVLLTNNEA